MPAVHPQDFSVMAVLQPQKIIHDSSHLWPMRSADKFLTNLIIGPATWVYDKTANRALRAILALRESSYLLPALVENSGPARLTTTVPQPDEAQPQRTFCTIPMAVKAFLGLEYRLGG